MLIALTTAGPISTEIVQARPACIAIEVSVDAPGASAMGRVWHRAGINQLAANPINKRPTVPKPQSTRKSPSCADKIQGVKLRLDTAPAGAPTADDRGPKWFMDPSYVPIAGSAVRIRISGALAGLDGSPPLRSIVAGFGKLATEARAGASCAAATTTDAITKRLPRASFNKNLRMVSSSRADAPFRGG
jgi:hypothetical protein